MNKLTEQQKEIIAYLMESGFQKSPMETVYKMISTKITDADSPRVKALQETTVSEELEILIFLAERTLHEIGKPQTKEKEQNYTDKLLELPQYIQRMTFEYLELAERMRKLVHLRKLKKDDGTDKWAEEQKILTRQSQGMLAYMNALGKRIDDAVEEEKWKN